MRFLGRSLVGVVLASVTLALMAWAYLLINGAVQARISAEPRVAPVRERVFTVNVIQAELGTQTPILETFGEVQSRRTLELRSAAGGACDCLGRSVRGRRQGHSRSGTGPH